MKHLLNCIFLFSFASVFGQVNWEFGFDLAGSYVKNKPSQKVYHKSFMFVPFQVLEEEIIDGINSKRATFDGLPTGLAIYAGYQINELFSIGVSFSYFGINQLRKEFNLYRYMYSHNNPPSFIQIDMYEATMHNEFVINPIVKYNFLKDKVRQLNAIVGIPFGIVNAEIENLSTISFNQNTHGDVYTQRYTQKGNSIGYNFGIEWVKYFSEKWGYTLSATYFQSKFRPTQMTMTEFTVNGKDELHTLTYRDKNFIFGSENYIDDSIVSTVLNSEIWNSQRVAITIGIVRSL